MTIFVLVPVFNRLPHTQRVVEALRTQHLPEPPEIIVIDDGSTDGTNTWLTTQPDVTTLKGDGNLWWGGAIELGLKHVLAGAKDDDYVLFLNNDTWFGPNYLETLIRISREQGGAAVGSVIHEEERDPPLVSIGARVDINRLAVWDLLAELPPAEVRHPKSVYRVQALSGRGTLYPAALFRRFGRMRTRWLPHYFADYEVAMRFARDGGVPLVVSSEAMVFSPPVYGNDVSRMGRWDRLFSPRSSSNVLRKMAFYLLVGSPLQRVTAPVRMAGFAILRALQLAFRRKTVRSQP